MLLFSCKPLLVSQTSMLLTKIDGVDALNNILLIGALLNPKPLTHFLLIGSPLSNALSNAALFLQFPAHLLIISA